MGLAPMQAQDFAGPTSAILTLDQEKLFNDSKVGRQILAEVERLLTELSEENREIEEKLVAEELDLTERRPTLTPAEFIELANAFDDKVQTIRAAQDAKSRELQRVQDEQRQKFLRQITPLLTDIVRERGAVVVMDRRAVLLSAQSVDITDEAIARINATVDAGEPIADDPPDETVIEPAPIDPAKP